MKHIPLLDKEEAHADAKGVWAQMPFDLALFHVTAHAANTFGKWATFNGSIWEEEQDGFPMLLKEMAVVQASVLAKSSYEWGNHGANMIRRGGTQEQLDALVAGNTTADVFSEHEKLALRFTTEVVEDSKPSEATLTAMAKTYSSKQLTQLVFGICVYMMNSRLANLAGCEIGDDEDFGNFNSGRKT